MADLETRSLKLANEYLVLGGKRLSKLDDNVVSTRTWDDEPEEAATFWKERVETLNDDERTDVETHLPSMNDR
ncbi:hypothetical protein [Rhizobium sp. NFR03]|uniref:hypothetical protein n=1 Tax=Rhizobium sp. NFR03 TaxID=1566263 RepID=UPI0008AD4E43|nr:hypothetical protein [Rhizobium sp. NFR03]SES47164.1 hypothetical protein SAMN03159406_04947 [Rhizobium sp. NFR03]